MTAETASQPTSPAPTKRQALLGLYAQTSLHPGSGTALGLVDMPVQRERHTLWPTIPGSAIKGVARDACREKIASCNDLDTLDRYDDKPDKKADRKGTRRERADATLRLNAAFGPPSQAAAEFAGAVSFTDARLLAFPVRSLAGVFAHVTCAAALRRLERDLELRRLVRDPEMSEHKVPWSVPRIDGDRALLPGANCPCLIGGETVVLEEYLFGKAEGACQELADWIAANLFPAAPAHQSTRDHFRTNLIVLADDWFTHFARHATEIMARVRLDYDTKTVTEGALFYEEFIPPEALFYSIVLADGGRSSGAQLDAAGVLRFIEQALPPVIQIGANQTTGKGFCFTRMTPLGD